MNFEILSLMKEIPVGIYGFLLLLYLFSQIFFSILEKRKQIKLKKIEIKTYPFVSILVPFYNELKSEMEDSIDSLLNLDYPKDKYEILVMDDGSTSNEVYLHLKSKYDENVKIFRQPNMGKREAQVALTKLKNPKTDYYLAVDSDSVLDKNCLKELVKTAILMNAQAVSGGILVKKQSQFLNKLLRVRYWAANWQERLSQSYFNQVSCCSGPCTLWDAKIFDKVSESYINQYFMGKKCTYGDDRHMTNLFLKEGCNIKMANEAFCFTSTPETWKKWIKQQTRWSKSFYRESYWSFKNLKDRMGWFFAYQNIMAFLLPFVLIANIKIYLLIYTPTKLSLILYLISVLVAGFIRGAYAFICTKDFTYFLAPIYGVIHFILVFPIRVLALFQLKDTKWGTR